MSTWNVFTKFLYNLLQVFDTLPKLNVNHINTNSSQKGKVQFEGLFSISLSVMRNNCRLVADRKIYTLNKKCHTCKMKGKKIIVVLKCKKNFFFRKLKKCLFCIFFKLYLCLRKGRWLFYLKTGKISPSEVVSSLRFLL